MILKELHEYYERLLEDPNAEVSARYWSNEKVGWEFEIDQEGMLISVLPLTSGDEKKPRQFMMMSVPEHDGRTSGVKPFFLCDNASYFLGLDKKNGDKKFEASNALHQSILSQCDDPAAKAACLFFEKRVENSEFLSEERKADLDKGAFIVLRLQGDMGLVHEKPAIKEVWLDYCLTKAGDNSSETSYGQCGVTGERTTLTKMFPLVAGIPGAQSSGASLVSFNNDSFESYGKKKTHNASVSEEVSFNAGSALKFLFNSPDHRKRLGQTTVLFWTDKPAPTEVKLFGSVLEGIPGLKKGDNAESEVDLKRIDSLLECVKKGLPLEGCDPKIRFYILGIAPNAARLAVRFFEMDTFGNLMAHYGDYLNDIEMIDVRPVSFYSLLCQISPRGELKEVPSSLINAFLHAVLTGTKFPRALLTMLISRINADHANKNAWDMGQRAALLKAYLNREMRYSTHDEKNAICKRRSFQMSLDRENTDEAYLLGRLFAILERAQSAALGETNATIKDRFFSSASSTPSRVFPALIKNGANHFAKLRKEKMGLCTILEKEMDSIFDGFQFGNSFPKRLDSEEQGAFYIGYYQERADLWKSRKKDEADSSDNTDE